jgi:hypothetical protein
MSVSILSSSERKVIRKTSGYTKLQRCRRIQGHRKLGWCRDMVEVVGCSHIVNSWVYYSSGKHKATSNQLRDLPGKITSDGSESFSSPLIPSERTGV